MDAAEHRRSRRRGRLAIACLAVASALLVQAAGWAQVSNFALVRALSDGTAQIDPYHWETRDVAWYRGHFYSVKAPVLPALSVPVWEVLKQPPLQRWVSGGAAIRPGAARGRVHRVHRQVVRDMRLIWVLVLFGAVLPAAVLMLLTRRLAERLEPGYGTATAVTLGLCTMVLPFSTLYFSHVLAALLGFAAFAVLWGERERGPAGSLPLVALGGLLAGVAFASEYPLALGGALLGVYAIARGDRLRRGLAYAGGALAGALPLAAYNLWAFGSIAHLSYANAVKVPGGSGHDVLGLNRSGFFGVTLPRPRVALELLFSAKGILATTPVLVMGIVGVVLLHRRGRRAEAWTIGGLAFAYLVYDSGYWLPFGGGTPGPRFLMPAIPFVALPIALAYRRFPLTTLGLAVPSALFMISATIANPLIANDEVGRWVTQIEAGDFVHTVATPLGAGHGWAAIAPVLAALVLAAGLAASTLRGLPRPAPDAATAALAVIGWCALASIGPWILGGRSVFAGDGEAADLIAAGAAAGLLVVGALAAGASGRRIIPRGLGVPRIAKGG